MKFVPKNIRKHQEGGAMAPAEAEMAPEQGAPLEGGQQDPMMMIALAAALALLNQDCLMAMQVCLALLQLMLQAQGGGALEAQGEPVFRRGGVLLRRIKK